MPVRIVGRLVLDRCVDNFFAETEQVAFCTRNIVPGIDFTNDPLLQGRNFSYLDTQIKRLGGPNFTHIPINAPNVRSIRCSRTATWRWSTPRGAPTTSRTPGAARPGARARIRARLPVVSRGGEGRKDRERSETFADHYSQARQFYLSQTQIERDHIGRFLRLRAEQGGKPRDPRAHGLALRNVDESLAQTVADGLGLAAMPKPVPAARPTIERLADSPALSILRNSPGTFTGRRVGSSSPTASTPRYWRRCERRLARPALLEIVAPKVGGVEAEDGNRIEAQQRIDGAPSVLYDAVALLLSEAGANELSTNPAIA